MNFLGTRKAYVVAVPDLVNDDDECSDRKGNELLVACLLRAPADREFGLKP
ncbi:hypothetical protein [Thauera aminoaromatica]|uniref:hypothetical protein n=1 Tax=Thauera aminoaromatica TaxID=164330 RepID=UPI0023F434F4|nr:hypothetical protein [Thauera aminoaromatica]